MKLAQYLKTHGSQTELARAIQAQPQLVWQWSTGVRPVPVARCMAIERATGGAVTCEELRPDKAADFAYLRGAVDVVGAEQHVALPAVDAALPAVDVAPTKADDAPALAWDGVDRRDFLNPADVPADLERRRPGVEAAGQGV